MVSINSCSCLCRVNSAMSTSDITLKEAVELLCSNDENGQLYGANFIQHVTFNEESTKTEVGLINTHLVAMRKHTLQTHTLWYLFSHILCVGIILCCFVTNVGEICEKLSVTWEFVSQLSLLLLMFVVSTMLLT